MYKKLNTERLTIRPIEINDADFIIELVNSEGWLKYIGNRNIYTEIDAQEYIQKILDNSNFYYSIFELKSSKKAIGIVTFLNREDLDFPDIGFALLPEYENNGYTLEASKKYMTEVFKTNIYKNIIAITSPNNLKSISLLSKLGLSFVSEYNTDNGTLSLFSLTEGNPEANTVNN